MSAADFLRSNATVLSQETPYERRFVEEVLARVGKLSWSAVQAQTAFVDADGTRRYIDFTISEGVFPRVAIEVDGYDKRGRGRGMTRREFADWSRREQAIAAAGYRVIRIANSLIDREPERCARTIELVLKRERALQARLAAIPPAQRPARTTLANALRRSYSGRTSETSSGGWPRFTPRQSPSSNNVSALRRRGVKPQSRPETRSARTARGCSRWRATSRSPLRGWRSPPRPRSFCSLEAMTTEPARQ